MEKLKEKFRKAMLEKDVNQNELACLTGLSISTISRLLNDPGNATANNLVKVGDKLGLSASEVFSSTHGDSFTGFPMKIEFFCKTHADFIFFMNLIKDHYDKHYGNEFFNKMYHGY
ncbi:helix-turn-helix domain-containing protein [Bacteroides sp. OttesenSCG-928-E20]|nr:helix-turn-helix domain-containing protein [Bacteroides sp. OttesenSCG-928-N06]MDL2299988.1 helix-turn-helix domain-containing protein [Bacteroides sp. OttesenSCG-928-E20]